MSRKLDVLVTGADQRQGLAVIRALGSKGLAVCAAGADPDSLGFFSRYTAARVRYPSPLREKRAFADAILRAVQTYRISVVMPAVESTVIALDEFREGIEAVCRLALPPRAALHAALDKKETLAHAARLGIPIPRTCYPSSRKEAADFAETVGYPVILKPRALSSFARGGGMQFKVAYARDRTELEHQLDTLCAPGSFPMLQEYCPGVKVDLGFLYAGGEMLGIYQYKGEREYPLTGGVTSLHVSMPLDPELRRWTECLLASIGYDGPGMIEFRVDERRGSKVLMELNPRFWAPQSAANRLGLNFPFAVYRYVREGRREALPATYAVGAKNRYLRGDLIALWHLWQGQTIPGLGPLPSRGRALANVLAGFSPGVQSDVMDWSDPWPGVREMFALVKHYGREVAGYYWHRVTDSSFGRISSG